MSATTDPIDEGNFGLSGVRLTILPGAPLDELVWSALILLNTALAVFDEISDADGVHDTFFAGLYSLRQASMVLSAAQMTPQQGEAALRAGGAA